MAAHDAKSDSLPQVITYHYYHKDRPSPFILFFFLMTRPPPKSPLFPHPTLFRPRGYPREKGVGGSSWRDPQRTGRGYNPARHSQTMLIFYFRRPESVKRSRFCVAVRLLFPNTSHASKCDDRTWNHEKPSQGKLI